jgi:predicted dehydrogenase
MQVALIGCNDDTLRIARAIANDASHALASIHNADEYREQLSEIFPEATWSEHWESLLAGDEVEAVVVTKHSGTIVFEDQCRKLVQAGIPIIASHPIGDSLFAYELEMMREEAGGVMLAYFPARRHSAIQRLAMLIHEGESSDIGVAEQLVIERRMPLRDRADVLRILAQDITLQRQLIGEISSINAVGAEPKAASLPNLAVSVTGRSDIVGRWSVVPKIDDCVATISLIGSQGTAVVTARDASNSWSIRIGEQDSGIESDDDGAAVLDELERMVAIPNAPSEWESVCHDLDAAEQIERSLRRKRTIEFRRDAQNEEGTFKGIMSAGGCVVLMLVFFMLIAFAIFEGFRMPLIDTEALRESGEATPRSHVLLRLWPVYPLAAFLLMQILVLVAKKSKTDRFTSGDHSIDG